MDRRDYHFLQLLSESELDDGFEQAEQADRAMMADLGFEGVTSGLTVVEHNPTADLTVDVALGTAYDSAGQRVRIPTGQVIDVSVDHLSVSTAVTGGAGFEKIVSVFAYFDRALSDPRIDGNSNTVFFVRDETFATKVVQGAETNSLPATPPALESDKVLLCDIRRSDGQTQILNSDITPTGAGTGTYTAISNRRQDAFVLSAGSLSISEGTPEASDQAILTELNNHIVGVSNLHLATAVDYAGSGAWHDGSSLAADTLEVTIDSLVADLAGSSGSDKIGSAALTAWLGGRTRPTGSIFDQLDAVGVDLGAQSAGDDGVERIGAEAHTSASAGGINLSLGSARSQLIELSDAAVSIAGNQTITGDKQLDGEVSFNNQLTHFLQTNSFVRIPQTSGDLTFQETTSGDSLFVIEADGTISVPKGNIEITNNVAQAIVVNEFSPGFSFDWTKRASPGANVSGEFIFNCQDGQDQTGSNDNNHGGGVRVELGRPGAGGSGADAFPGAFILDLVRLAGDPRMSVIGDLEQVVNALAVGTLARWSWDNNGLNGTRGNILAVGFGLVQETASLSSHGTFILAKHFYVTGGNMLTAGTATTIHSDDNLTGTMTPSITGTGNDIIELRCSGVNAQTFMQGWLMVFCLGA